MRGRLVLAGLGLVVGTSNLFAQFPPIPPPLAPQGPPPANPQPPAYAPPPYQPLTPPLQIPRLPEPPRPSSGGLTSPGSPGFPAPGVTPPGMLPPGFGATPPNFPQPVMPAAASGPTPPGLPDGSTLPLQIDVPLPYPEERIPLDPAAVTMKRVNNSWQVWAGQRVLKDLGDREESAKEVVRVLRELHPTQWVAIGGPRPVVEYGLIDGRPPVTGAFPRQVVPIDLKSVRVEPVKGVWCLRDDDSILFNFGLRKADAEQALAVVRKYGFNRVGVAGHPAPAMTYFFVSLEAPTARPPLGALNVVAQENAMTRTGIPVPGVGFVGEMIRIDPRKVDVRREGGDWVLAFGQDVLGHFGAGEWAARDALRLVQDCKFTEFCRLGGATGLTFFLVNGKAPTRVPLAAQGRRFSLNELKAQPVGDRWTVTESGRHLFDAGGPDEAETLIRVLKYFQFDQVCQMGPSPRSGLMFLAKSR